MGAWENAIEGLKKDVKYELIIMDDNDEFYFPSNDELIEFITDYEVGVYDTELDDLIASNPDIITHAACMCSEDSWNIKHKAVYLAVYETFWNEVVPELKEEFLEALVDNISSLEISLGSLKVTIEEG